MIETPPIWIKALTSLLIFFTKNKCPPPFLPWTFRPTCNPTFTLFFPKILFLRSCKERCGRFLVLKISFPKDAALLNRNTSYRVAILSSSCGHVNPNLHCSPPQHWQTCSISSPLLSIIEYVAKQRQVPRSYPSQEHDYSAGWRVIPPFCISDSHTIKVQHMSCCNTRPNYMYFLMTGTLHQKIGEFLIQIPALTSG